jgi:hypothetical protein
MSIGPAAPDQKLRAGPNDAIAFAYDRRYEAPQNWRIYIELVRQLADRYWRSPNQLGEDEVCPISLHA